MPPYGIPAQDQPGSSHSQLQQTIAAATANGIEPTPGVPHHPITCNGDLFYDEDGVLSCLHAKVPADDARTQAALHHTVALLIIEMAMKL